MPKTKSKSKKAHTYPERIKTGTPGIYYRATAKGKSYSAIYRDSDGKTRWTPAVSSLKQAKAAKAQIELDKQRGKRVAPDKTWTFGKAAAAYREARFPGLSAGTRNAYGSNLDQHLLPALGNKRLDQISVDDMARLIQTKQNGNDKLKAWTINGMLVVASQVFQYAARRMHWAGQNPIPLLEKSERPQNDAKKKRILKEDEIYSLLDVARIEDEKRDTSYALIFDLDIRTGLRLGECLGLQWGDIDFDKGMLSVRRQTDKTGKLLPKLKTERSKREIPLVPHLVTALAELSKHVPSEDQDWVFATKAGTPHWHRNVSGRTMARLVKKAGIHDPDKPPDPDKPAPTFHDLRDTCASIWIAGGVSLPTVSALLGHSSPAITARVYVHEFEKQERSGNERLLEQMGAAMGGGSRYTAR